jgi:prepilin signal peptidase PulO-like enzyme (type II secretory pathway)
VLAIIVTAAFFGCVAFLATQVSRIVCADVTPLADGPTPGTAPGPVLIACAAIVGGLIAHDSGAFQLGIMALVVFALVAAWCSDARCGLVPDALTLGPLAAIVLVMAVTRQWGPLVWAAIPLVPFAAAAAFSRGRGMGWGDVKLSAFAGLALGAPLALFALAFACAAAVVVHRVKRMQGDQPIAFAPYISAFIGLALPLAAGTVH